MRKTVHKQMDAQDERQHMLTESYEIYEKNGAPVGATSLHYHDFYELMYIAEGEFDIYVEPSIYHLKQGDFLLVGRNRLHHYLYEPGKHDQSRRILLWITDSELNRLSRGLLDFSVCFSGSGCAYHFPLHYEYMLNDYLLKLVLVETVSEDATSAHAIRNLMDNSYLTLFFAQLYHLCQDRDYSFPNQEIRKHPLVQIVSNYIDTHLADDLTLELLARQIPMSKYHFLRSFKAYTNLTIHQFLLQKRLIAACEQMRQGIAPKEAAEKCGFTDYSSFYRNFKATYGLSPREYKEQYIK